MQVLFTGVWNWLILCLLLSSIIQTGAILTGRRKTLRSTPKPDLSYNVSTSNENHIFVDEIEEQILGWAKWSQWSACSKTCGGGGIQFQLRRCLDVRCSGPSKRHRLCEIQECPYGSRTDVEIECSLRDTVFSGNNLPERWIPLLHKNQCTLVCQSELTGQNRNFNTSLKDGTVCKREDVEKAACLQGKCERVGCDMIIGSSAQFDQCGVCGGNGESCGRNVFRWKDTQQFSPCDKTCGPDSYRVSVSICWNIISERVVPERLCADQPRPRPQVRKCPYVVCPANPTPALDYTWMTSPWKDCSVSCGGGYQTRDVFCVETYQDTSNEIHDSQNSIENRKVADQYCWETKRPTTERQCAIDECPGWEKGEWSQCSVTCDKGIRKRMVECRQNGGRVEPTLCLVDEKPTEKQSCYTDVSCKAVKAFDGANLLNYDRYRFVAESPFSQWNNDVGYSVQEPADFVSDFQSNAEKTKPKFYAGPWGDCSTTCGSGVKTRSVECVAFQGITTNVIKLPDNECDGQTKPSLFQPCQIRACAQKQSEDESNDVMDPGLQSDSGVDSNGHASTNYRGARGSYRWDYGEWGPCSASCLGGKQKSTLKCVDMNRKITVPWSYCDAKQRPIDLSRSCNNHPCPPSWETGPLSECSHTCGGGIRTRKVRCTRRVSRVGGAESTLILPDAQCPQPKPFHQEPCGLTDCPPNWRVEQWTSCSTSCGAGEQRRTVICEQRVASGVLQTFNPPDQCSGIERPSTVQLCDLGPCDSPYSYNSFIPTPASLVSSDGIGPGYTIAGQEPESAQSEEMANYDQDQTSHKKLTLNIGGYANLYEGTSIKVKCPVKNFERNRIVWTKDGRQVINNAHIKVSTNGALRIFHARMEDAGTYACFANGVQGNVTLKFKPRDHDKQQTQLSNETKPQKLSTKPEKQETESDVIKENLTPSDVDRELIHKVQNNLHKLGEFRMLEKLRNVREPGNIKVDYAIGDWSRCSQEECGKPDGAQVRLLKCRINLDHMSAYVDDEICDSFGIVRPPSSRACHDPNCPRWDASDWTECSESRCVRHGTSLQRREVKCLYQNGTEADFSLCDRKNRPKIKKECVNELCTAEWRPSIWGKCSKKCGDGGVQMRLLRCVWKGTRKAAGRNCDATLRPPAIRSCAETTLPPCVPGQDYDSSEKSPLQQSNSETDEESSNDTRLASDSSALSPSQLNLPELAPFQGWEKWRGWRLYNWEPPENLRRLDDSRKRI